MKARTSVVASFVVGAAIASLPYTLSSRHTVAQGAGPAQTQGGLGGFGGGNGGGGQAGGIGQGFPAQGRQIGSPAVTSMTASGEFLFAASGDSVYKIRISNMAIEGQTRLPAMRGPQGGGQPTRANGRPPQGGGNIPPTK